MTKLRKNVEIEISHAHQQSKPVKLYPTMYSLSPELVISFPFSFYLLLFFKMGLRRLFFNLLLMLFVVGMEAFRVLINRGVFVLFLSFFPPSI